MVKTRCTYNRWRVFLKTRCTYNRWRVFLKTRCTYNRWRVFLKTRCTYNRWWVFLKTNVVLEVVYASITKRVTSSGGGSQKCKKQRDVDSSHIIGIPSLNALLICLASRVLSLQCIQHRLTYPSPARIVILETDMKYK